MKIFEKFIKKVERKRLNDLISRLDSFSKQVSLKDSISSYSSIQNLADCVLEVRINENGNCYASNGLLITNDGYFLTALHCLGSNPEPQGVVRDNHKEYNIEKICAVSKNSDLALAKAKMNNNMEINYKIYDFSNSHEDFNLIKIITRKDFLVHSSYGFVDFSFFLQYANKSEMYQNHFSFTGYDVAIKGNSGGLIVNNQGELIGLASTCSKNGSYAGNAVKISRALSLVDTFKKTLEKKMTGN